MISFREITSDDAKMILTWRTNPNVDKWMLNHVEKDLYKQQSWIRSMRNNEFSYHWIARNYDKDIAYVKFYDLDIVNRCAFAGFYIGDSTHSSLTINILHTFYVALFIHLGLTSISAGVLDGNNIVKIHMFSGYESDPSRAPDILNKGSSSFCIKYYVLRKEKFLLRHPYKNVAELPMKLWCTNTAKDLSGSHTR